MAAELPPALVRRALDLRACTEPRRAAQTTTLAGLALDAAHVADAPGARDAAGGAS